jgi:hypothetical protein
MGGSRVVVIAVLISPMFFGCAGSVLGYDCGSG